MEIMVLKLDKLDLKPVSATYLAESVEDSVKLLLDDSGITLYINVDECIINIDFDLIKTVLINLIDNARKASQSGSSVELTGNSVYNGYMFAVKDYGVGISEEDFRGRQKNFIWLINQEQENRAVPEWDCLMLKNSRNARRKTDN